ncbi:MAG: RluA family pseudouridine synthase [Rhodospirillaceae bacterium]|nr:RluA family pseudouridine synthase [Rhodospirillaceae bacterium]
MTTVTTTKVTHDEADVRLDRWFKRHHPGLTHGRLQKLLRSGQVRVDGKRVKANARLVPGQMVRIPPLNLDNVETASDRPTVERNKPAVSDEDAEALRQSVLYMDDDVIAINKPPGLAVQGGTGIGRNIDDMLDVLRFDAKERPRLVHRLDKDTSGVLLLGRTATSTASLAETFRSKTARKVYWAVIVGVTEPAAGKINLSISKLPGHKGERVVPDADGGKRAVTLFRTVERASRKASWMVLEPQTGRTHQLRVHMSYLGTPILGDGKYGASDAFLQGPGLSRKLHLHARAIRVPHPRQGTLEVVAPLSEHMRATWRFLGFDEKLEADPFIDLEPES